MDGHIVRNTQSRSIANRPASWKDGIVTLLAYLIVVLGIIAMLAYNLRVIVPRLIGLAEHHHILKVFMYPSLLWMFMGATMLIFRTIVWFFYRPFPPATLDDAPAMTIVIPAYNEGRMVRNAVISAARANYPHDRFEIIAIDDGSTDDTWEHITDAATLYPHLVTTLRHDANRGKRAALALGFERARGDIIVSLDSDSVVDPEALLALAGPFCNPRVGAVAGKVLVYNRRGLIPRMLHARFIMSFDFLRAVESAYGNVFCCPGALSALRASAIRPLVGRWKSQTFLGLPCTIGEDRAMTNYLFEAGFDTVYQGSAIVHTVVPHRFAKLCKMLLRWDRSYVREEFRFARIAWKRPLKTRLIALCDRFVTNMRYPVFYASLALLVPLLISDPSTITRMLGAIGFVSFFNMAYFIRSERSFEFLWGVAYAYVAVFTLWWIFPYAAVTVNKRGWLTR